MSGRVSLMFDRAVWGLPFIKEGRFKAIAVSGSTRTAAAPDVPTVGKRSDTIMREGGLGESL